MKWFGLQPFGPMCGDDNRCAAPVGIHCSHCDERVAALEAGVILPPDATVLHVECFIRGIVGSVGHQMSECSCFGRDDTSEDDVPTREAARRSMRFFLQRVQLGRVMNQHGGSVN